MTNHQHNLETQRERFMQELLHTRKAVGELFDQFAVNTSLQGVRRRISELKTVLMHLTEEIDTLEKILEKLGE